MHSKLYEWGYVSSKANPADKITGGLTAKALVRDELWFNALRFYNFHLASGLLHSPSCQSRMKLTSSMIFKMLSQCLRLLEEILQVKFLFVQRV